MTTNQVLQEIALERLSQMKKWGEQNHPLGTHPDNGLSVDTRGKSFSTLAMMFTQATDQYAGSGNLTWLDILLEEVFEFSAESDRVKARTEAIQVAAVACAIVECIDRSILGPKAGD